MTTAAPSRLSFHLPPSLEAGSPPESRGLTRDGVRMMVVRRSDCRPVDSTFALLPTFLYPGDVVVINTSGTMAAAVPARPIGPDASHEAVIVHFSADLGDGHWVVELRLPDEHGHGHGHGTIRWPQGHTPPVHLSLGEDGSELHIIGPYLGSTRLWRAEVRTKAPVMRWLGVHGRPIRYGYAQRPWPLTAYQNVYATEPGSAEMPSAGRPFTPEVITRLVAKGVDVVPLILHTGVASLEADELPYPERLRVPPGTARRVNAARSNGGRVIAVGTTVVRALESAVEPGTCLVRPQDGWTDLVITPESGVRVVDGMLTGWHEPEASHLLMLEAVAGRPLLQVSYDQALEQGYLFHEFGDVHLILP